MRAAVAAAACTGGSSCCVVDWFLLVCSFLLFSTRCVNTKYCINSEKVPQRVNSLRAFDVCIRSESMHHNSGYRGRGGGGGHYNGHRPHNSKPNPVDFYLSSYCQILQKSAVLNNIKPFKTLKMRPLRSRLQLCAQRKGAPPAARAQRRPVPPYGRPGPLRKW